MTEFQAFEAQAIHEKNLLNKPNVVGVGVGYKDKDGVPTDEVAVVVLVERKKPLAALQPEEVIPRELEGMRTDVLEIGQIWANQTPKERFRPVIPSGVSIGHYKITAGTLGTMVKDKRTGDMFVLSNNHVLANCNDAMLGDAILQPAAMDGGLNPADVVAKLERYVKLGFIGDTQFNTPEVVGFPIDPPTEPTPDPTPIPPSSPPTSPTAPAASCDILSVLISLLNGIAGLFGSSKRVQAVSVAQAVSQGVSGPSPVFGARAFDAQAAPQNTCDCALGRPVDPALFSDDIQQIGIVNATATPTLGMRIRKYGRTTGYTEGSIKLLNATVNVGYATAHGNKQAQFVGQVIADPMSQGGDSGSLIVDASDNRAVGLLFAGSSLATIFTPIDVVLTTLGIDI